MDDKDLETLREEAVAQGAAFGKGRLRDQYRMKPGKDAQPHKWVRNPYNRSSYPIYLVSDCVPVRNQNKPRTAAQERSAKVLAAKARLRSNIALAGLEVSKWLSNDCVVLDTETTGLNQTRYDQIVELAVIDADGTPLIDQRFRPSIDIEPGAKAVHGISLDDLSNEPIWPKHFSQVRRLLLSRPVVIFSADFDLGILASTSQAFGLDTDWVKEIDHHCAMELAADAFGATNRYGTISLANAAAEAGVVWEGDAHSALTDAKATLGILQYLSGHRAELEAALTKLYPELES